MTFSALPLTCHDLPCPSTDLPLPSVPSPLTFHDLPCPSVLQAGRRLRAALGCEAVGTRDAAVGARGGARNGARDGGGGATAAAMWLEMYEELLRDAAAMRSALDGRWSGLRVSLERSPCDLVRSRRDLERSPRDFDDADESSGSRGSRAAPRAMPPPVEIGDAPCGGGTLHLRGLVGVTEARPFVDREWARLRDCQERHALISCDLPWRCRNLPCSPMLFHDLLCSPLISSDLLRSPLISSDLL